MKTLVVLALLSVPIAGCQRGARSPANDVAAVAVSRQQIDAGMSAQTGYFAYGNIAQIEEVPDGVPNSSIADEFRLVPSPAGQQCVNVVMRAPTEHDDPLSALSFECVSGGRRARALVQEGASTTVEHAYNENRSAVEVGGANIDIRAGSQRPPDIFRTIERQGAFCCHAPADGKLYVLVENPRRKGRHGVWNQAYGWHIH